MLTEAFTVDFHDHTLYTTKVGDVVYVAMKPIVEGMGLDWGTQRRKIADSTERYGTIYMPLQTAGGIQKMLCIPMENLNKWYFSINPQRTKPSAEAAYRDSLAQELTNYGWQVEIEKQTSMGRIDIYATAGRVLIVECKMKAAHAASALGQLLFYQQNFPEAWLVFACQQRLSTEKKRVFESHKILTISSLDEICALLGETSTAISDAD